LKFSRLFHQDQDQDFIFLSLRSLETKTLVSEIKSLLTLHTIGPYSFIYVVTINDNIVMTRNGLFYADVLKLLTHSLTFVAASYIAYNRLRNRRAKPMLSNSMTHDRRTETASSVVHRLEWNAVRPIEWFGR